MVRKSLFYLLLVAHLGGALYAQEIQPEEAPEREPRLLREILGVKDYTFVEGAFVELTPEERTQFMMATRHIVNNAYITFQMVDLERTDTFSEADQKLCREIILKIQEVRGTFGGARGMVTPQTTSELMIHLVQARELAIQLEDLISRTEPTPFSVTSTSKLRKGARDLSNFFELSLRVFENRPGEGFTV